MTAADAKQNQKIVIDEIFPHAPEMVWKALTSGALMARWLMEPTGFAPEVGKNFTFRTTPAGAWDGLIRCQVLEVIPNEYFAYSWRGGDAANVGYGSKLDTVVSYTLTPAAEGTRLKVVHAGFELPRNETAYENMSKGWGTCIDRLGELVEQRGED